MGTGVFLCQQAGPAVPRRRERLSEMRANNSGKSLLYFEAMTRLLQVKIPRGLTVLASGRWHPGHENSPVGEQENEEPLGGGRGGARKYVVGSVLEL